MIITKKHLSRRTFLRGTFGATMALPLLDAMVPALTAQTKTAASTPFRFGAIYMPNGVYPDTWHPELVGSDFEFKPVMKPLEPFRSQLVTVSKMKAPWGESVHLGASSAFLNGVGPVGNREGTGDAFGKIQSKKTVDQYIADCVADDTPLRSIEVGTEDMGTAVGACDGFPCTFFNALSWQNDISRCRSASTRGSPSSGCSARPGTPSSARGGSRRSRACSTPSRRKPRSCAS